MFADEFLYVMLNDPNVVASSERFRKSSANFINLRRSSKNARKRSYGLRTTLGQSSEIFGLEIAKVAQNCPKGFVKRKKVAR